MTFSTFDITPSVRFGFGLLDRTGESAAPLLRARVTIVTDRVMMATDMTGHAEPALRAMASGVMKQARLMSAPHKVAQAETLGIYGTVW